MDYIDRKTKQLFVFRKYQDYLLGSVLDVGADAMHLKQYLPPEVSYVGVGLGDAPELIKVDFEKEVMPFEKVSFDCVLCLDVLEHLDNVHNFFNQICSLAKKNVIISLPNPYGDFFRYLSVGKGSIGSENNFKFYGLPINKPQDRHKWFFSALEADKFVRQQAQINGFTVIDYYTAKGRRFYFKKIFFTVLSIFFNRINPEDFLCGTGWWVLQREKSL